MITIHPTSVIMKSIHPITNPASSPDDDEVHVVTVHIGANNRKINFKYSFENKEDLLAVTSNGTVIGKKML